MGQFVLSLLLCHCVVLIWVQHVSSNLTVTTSSSTSTGALTTSAPPPNVNDVSVLSRTETKLTLKWDKVNNSSSYRLSYNEKNEYINGSDFTGLKVNHTVSSLSPGTKYTFTLYTVLEEKESSGYTFTAITTPPNVNNVSVTSHTETELTLQWNKVNNSNNYSYRLSYNGNNNNITVSDGGSVVIYTVLFLSPGTKYTFTLNTVYEGVKSSGYNFTSVTTPPNVNNVSVTSRTETELTLQWNKVNDSNSYSYRLSYNGNTKNNISGSQDDSLVNHTVSSLSSGTKYTFTLYTVYEGVESSGYNFTSVTTPPNVNDVSVTSHTETELTLQWNKVNDSNSYSYRLSYNGNTKNNISGSQDDSLVNHTVSSLSPGTKYTFTLYTVFEEEESSGYTFTSVTTPPNVNDVSVTSHTETELTLQWNKVNDSNSYSYRLSYNGNTKNNISGSQDDSLVNHTVSSLSPGTKYTFTLYTVFEEEESSGYTFTSVTTPPNVNDVSVSHTETELTLQWNKVNDSNSYSYRLSYNGNTKNNISGSQDDSLVNHTVSSLSPGTKYTFTLYTVFEEEESSGYTFTSVTTPSDINNVSVTSRTETELTLQWNKVNNSNNYGYRLNYNGINININRPEGDSVVNHTVSSLLPGTKYNFILYTVFEGVESSGYNYSTVTTPSIVTSMSVNSRTETELTLQWNKVNNSSSYSYRLTYNEININYISGSEGGSVVTHRVASLSNGSKYTFTLYTVFEGEESSGYIYTTVTTPSSVSDVSVKSRTETTLTLEWNKVNNSSSYNYRLNYDTTKFTSSESDGGSVVTHTVSSLSPGTKYTFILYTVFEEVKSSGHTFTSVTIPAAVTGLYCKYASGGNGLTVLWDPPNGQRTSVQVNVKGQSVNASGESVYIERLQPAQWYTLNVTALSWGLQSNSASITCQTDPGGVIAGVLVFLLLIIILFVGIFIWRRKPALPSVFRNSKSNSFVQKNLPSDKYKPIPLKKFPEHFNSLCCDEHRGFSVEYEDLSTVGTDQSRVAALLPENKSKNRFTNVLAYDISRVKLAGQGVPGSDYINANYMPGYGKNNRQYIAAQGPLPGTVSDFWRMLWEQKSTAIVMLTNCVEDGRPKCEQYWPLDYTPCIYGNVLVTIQSEQKEKSWTLREFVVRNKASSEERTVTHFHFTAWPDHGVPTGTDELIQFREIVRQHIERFPSTGPAIVHCSAGVGRTGTLIALDTLLQQLVKEEAVNIAACVHRMRLCRPLMVQTESQYVFLHHCIMDSLQPKEDFIQEPIYENSDMIYENALVLKEYSGNSPV